MAKITKKMLKNVAAGTTAAAALTAAVLVSPPADVSDTAVIDDAPSVTQVAELQTDAEQTAPDTAEETDSEKDKDKTEQAEGSTNEESTEHAVPEEKPTDEYTTEIPYRLKKTSDYATTLVIDVPNNIQADIVEMYINDTVEVDVALIPTEPKFTSIPIVFDDLQKLSFKLYRLDECIGTAVFKGGKLMTNAKAVE